MKIGTVIILSPKEIEICAGIARERMDKNRAKGNINPIQGSLSNWEMDFQGACAEWAGAKGFNVYPNMLDTSLRNQNNDYGDFTLHDLRNVDIKQTRHLTGHLIVEPWKTGKYIDLFGLMVGVAPSFTFRGVMKACDLMVDSRLGNPLFTPGTWSAPQFDLVEVSECSFFSTTQVVASGATTTLASTLSPNSKRPGKKLLVSHGIAHGQSSRAEN